MFELGVVAHACNPSTQEARVGGLRVGASLGYIVSSWPSALHRETLSKNKEKKGWEERRKQKKKGRKKTVKESMLRILHLDLFLDCR
jgi:hypothetical protein